MIREIYCKLNSDRDYEEKVETLEEKEQILQQVKMILGTKPGDVLGNYNFGIDIQKYLFALHFSEEEILLALNIVLATYLRYDTQKWSVYADVAFGHNVDDAYEYAVIDIVINQSKCLGILVNQQ